MAMNREDILQEVQGEYDIEWGNQACHRRYHDRHGR